MSVTAKDVSYIAELARLRFTDEEMVTMTTELNNILPALGSSSVLLNAPDKQDRFFKVPKVIG